MKMRLCLLFLLYVQCAFAEPNTALLSFIEKEKTPYLETLKGLVSIESGSRDREGLDQISALIFEKLRK